ncbi:hypothetical protein NDU88_006270 [Pleurodeles waltl]|uniref:Uncharacterized protein n=1 Tax=Pleurodeles waltl TaxID=8319 RepID=A0AAV7L377_PLEWA|nr:hypothetical protein NDU88_006270 [Pleurodeles waltl]
MAWSTAAFRSLGAPRAAHPETNGVEYCGLPTPRIPCAAHPETNGVEYCGLPTPRSPPRCAPRNQWRGVLRPSDP